MKHEKESTTVTFMFPKASNKDFKLAPAGLYVMKLKAINEVASKDFETGEPKQRAQWTFTFERVIDANDEAGAEEMIGADFLAWTNITLGKKATMRAYTEALLGRPLERDEQPDTDDLIGRRVKVTLERYTKESGEPGVRVGSMIAYKSTPLAPAKPARASVAVADEDEDSEPF